jgi:RNA polymerase sigma-70 factor (sigma-E family)
MANDDERRLSNLFATLAREHVVVIPRLDMPNTDDVQDIDTVAQVSPYAGFDSFVREHSQRLGRAAYLLTGDRHLAEDLVQTALAKVAIRWEQVVAKGDPAPYVRTVIIRTAIGWRRRRWHGEVPTSPLPDTPDTGAARNVDTRDRLRRALISVPPRQRAAIVLRFYEDLSEADTAKAMGCSVGTVKSQTAKGLARLRDLLGNESIHTDQENER